MQPISNDQLNAALSEIATALEASEGPIPFNMAKACGTACCLGGKLALLLHGFSIDAIFSPGFHGPLPFEARELQTSVVASSCLLFHDTATAVRLQRLFHPYEYADRYCVTHGVPLEPDSLFSYTSYIWRNIPPHLAARAVRNFLRGDEQPWADVPMMDKIDAEHISCGHDA